jgi:DNA polymerase III subunit beta
MKFVISTQELNALISKIQNVVALKPTIPILSNFLIEAYNDELILTATDLTVGIRCHTEAKILEEGATTLPAKRLAQLIRELTTINIEISSNANEVTTLVAGTSRFKLNGMNKTEFPSLPDLSNTHSFHIKQSDLKDLLYRTSFAVSKEDNRYVLTGVLMQIINQQATFVGTDGKRLARSYITIDVAPEFTSQSIIPLKAVDEILKNLTDEGEAKISLMPDKIAVEANQTIILTKLLSGDYPDVNRVIPDQAENIMTLHREELMTLLRQVSLFTADNHHSVRFSFGEGELKLTANTMDIGEGHVAMPVNYQGPKLEIAFNPGFFLDILRHCKEETVTMGLIDAYNPGLITDGQQASKLHQATPLFVIMPMRLSED